MISKEETTNWVKNGPDKLILEKVELTGKELADKNKGISSSQIRNIFNKIVEIESKGFSYKQADFLMLKPLTAYSAKRANKQSFNHLKENLINPGIEAVLNSNDKEKAFKNFVMLFEAVLAYHKAYGAK
jgi:CRISPR-associated protein Csm2